MSPPKEKPRPKRAGADRHTQNATQGDKPRVNSSTRAPAKTSTKGNADAGLAQLFKFKLKESCLSPKDADTLNLKLCETAPKWAQLSAPGFLIPYPDLDGNPSGFCRFRYLRQPASNKPANTKPLRYTQPAGAAPELYLPSLVDWRKVANNATQPIAITEGELKAACGTARTKYPTIGLGGVWNFRAASSGQTWLPQFNEFQWERRRVYIAYDSDAATNENVVSAENELARVLTELKAEPHIVRLPTKPDGTKCGLDDYIATFSAGQLEQLVGQSRAWRPTAARSDTPPAMQVVDFAASNAPLAPVTFAVAGLLPHRNVTLLSGNGGAGKSNLALTLCAHVAAGVEWNGFAVTQGKVMLISMEDESEILRRRLLHIVTAYELDAAVVRASLRLVDATDDEFLAVECAGNGERYLRFTASFSAMTERVEEYAPTLIVIDNASEAFGANENERRMVRAFMRALARLARVQGAAVLLLAHIDKGSARYGGEGNTFSGSTAWHNGPRSRLVLVPDAKAPDRVNLSVEKHQYSGPVPEMRLTWTADGVLKPDGTVADAERKDRSVDAAVVYEAMAALIAQGATLSASSGGPNQASSFLLNSGRLDWYRSETRRVKAALDQLIADGKVVVDEYYDSNARRNRKRYILREHLPASKVRR